MIDGVRMRFCVMVWNTTVETPTAVAITSIATTVRLRTFSANSSDPGMSVNRYTAASASTAMMSAANRVCGRAHRRRSAANVGAERVRVSVGTAPPSQQQPEEESGAHDTDDDRQRHLVGESHDASDEI